MSFIEVLPDDPPLLINELERLMSRALKAPDIKAAYVVRIADWFGPRWLGFSGKIAGAAGVKSAELTLPPFVPARVLSKSYFRRDKAAFNPAAAPLVLHVSQSGSANLKRQIAKLAADTAFFWFSCSNPSDPRAALMMYHPSPSGAMVGSYSGFRVSATLKVVARLSFPPDEPSMRLMRPAATAPRERR